MAERKITRRDFNNVADYIVEEKMRRKKDRKDLEDQWEEIDRQVRMEPDRSYKLLLDGKVDQKKKWMSEMELPLQAQALEVLTADSRRMMFPNTGNWYRAKAYTDDEYLEGIDFQSLVYGDENDVPTQITQDNVNKITEGFVSCFHKQYDLEGHMDLINAESFKYGCGVGRVREVSKVIFSRTQKGVVKQNRKIPVLFPRSIKNTYLDDSSHKMMNEGIAFGESVIDCHKARLEEYIHAAKNGSSEPNSLSGGWMASGFNGIEADKQGYVEIIEYEGDLIIPRKTTPSIKVPNVLATVVVGCGEDAKASVVRLRYKKTSVNSNIIFPYHMECVDSPYASGPLMKGRPVQIAATNALNRLMDAAALKNAPPIGYDKDDYTFAANGGPVIHPYAQFETTSDLRVYDFADPSAMLQVYVGLLQQYSDLTGVNAPRLGAQTVSHTTAFAKNVEQQRGVARTVDYVQSAGKSGLTQFLHMEYEMARESLRGEATFWIDAYNGAVTVTKDQLPERVEFEWLGSNGPAEEQSKNNSMLQSAQLALSIDQMGIQLGKQPVIDTTDLIREVLGKGGWTDVDAITNSERVSGASPMGGIPEVDPSTAIEALQSLQG